MKLFITVLFFSIMSHAELVFESINGTYSVESTNCRGMYASTCNDIVSIEIGYDSTKKKSYIFEQHESSDSETLWIAEETQVTPNLYSESYIMGNNLGTYAFWNQDTWTKTDSGSINQSVEFNKDANGLITLRSMHKNVQNGYSIIYLEKLLTLKKQ